MCGQVFNKVVNPNVTLITVQLVLTLPVIKVHVFHRTSLVPLGEQRKKSDV